VKHLHLLSTINLLVKELGCEIRISPRNTPGSRFQDYFSAGLENFTNFTLFHIATLLHYTCPAGIFFVCDFPYVCTFCKIFPLHFSYSSLQTLHLQCVYSPLVWMKVVVLICHSTTYLIRSYCIYWSMW
jgi:hypothetical protein